MNKRELYYIGNYLKNRHIKIKSRIKQIYIKIQIPEFTSICISWKSDSNRRPADYESAALPTEPFQQKNIRDKKYYIKYLKKLQLFFKKSCSFF